MKGIPVNALIAINALLLGAFVLTVFNRARQGDASPREPEPGAPILSIEPAVNRADEGSPRPRDERERASSLPFHQLYSPDVRQFAANLRAAGCPEETVAKAIPRDMPFAVPPRVMEVIHQDQTALSSGGPVGDPWWP